MRSGAESLVQDPSQAGKKKDGLRRVYVASKTGMIYQINYDDETLEATYRTNETAIYSIAINQAFCVTGSEDQYLRIWALDFNEFLMEAKHEGTTAKQVMNRLLTPLSGLHISVMYFYLLLDLDNAFCVVNKY